MDTLYFLNLNLAICKTRSMVLPVFAVLDGVGASKIFLSMGNHVFLLFAIIA